MASLLESLNDRAALAITVALAALSLASIAFALLLRRAGIPGRARAAAVVGGTVIGLLAGPSVLGRTAPDLYEAVFLSGASERVEAEAAHGERRAMVAALRASDVSPVALDEQTAELSARVEHTTRAWHDAQAARMDAFARTMQALALLAGAASIVSVRRWRDPGPLLGAATAVFAIIALLPPIVAARAFTPLGWDGAIAMGACFALVSPVRTRGVRVVPAAIRDALVATLCAAMGAQVDVHALGGSVWWLGLAIALLWSNDGRAVGVAGALRVTGTHKRLWSIGALRVNHGAALLTLIAGSFALEAIGYLDRGGFLLSVLISACLVELLRDTRLWIARQLDGNGRALGGADDAE
ncbi:MAG: hypothetical protein AAGD00_09430 [Planctomycetota bacterium]